MAKSIVPLMLETKSVFISVLALDVVVVVVNLILLGTSMIQLENQ
jgi:hypothetical protein